MSSDQPAQNAGGERRQVVLALDERGDDEAREAADEPRGCKLMFIGKNLDVNEIRQGFNSCLATEENRDKRAARLRFRIGDVMECNTGAWKRGKVVSLFYREGTMTAPYQVELDDGSLIYAPADDDRLIRKPASDS